MNSKLLNFFLFQIGWFACVLGAAQNYEILGILISGAIVIFTISLSNYKIETSLFILIVAFTGFFWDSLLVQLNIFSYTDNGLQDFAPVWIAALWASFSTTINSSMAWLNQRYFLAAILGGVFGPIAYISASKLGALNIVSFLEAVLYQAIAWAIFLPAMFWFNQSINQELLKIKLKESK